MLIPLIFGLVGLARMVHLIVGLVNVSSDVPTSTWLAFWPRYFYVMFALGSAFLVWITMTRTTMAAWVTMVTGLVLSAGGFVYRVIDPTFLDGRIMAFWVSMIRILLYVVEVRRTLDKPQPAGGRSDR